MAIKKSKITDEWQSWALAAQQGDKRAYAKLLGELAPYIKNVIIKSLSNQDAAEDIAQEVLISIHKSLQTYSPERPFKPWLHAIINFRRTDYLRKYYAKKEDMTSTTTDNPEFLNQNVTNAPFAGELKDIEMALGSLPPAQKRIFEMIKIQGYTAKEVANEMNMKETAVKVSAHRSMKKIQSILK